MQFTGTVISVNLATKKEKQGGGFYDAWELIYRSPENEVKELAKPIQSLKFTKGLKDSLSALKPNDQFVCNLEKNARDYWEVETISKVDEKAAEQKAPAEGDKPQPSGVVPPVSAAHTPRSGKVLGSTYETPEERAKKQVIIVRQSSIDYALKYMTTRYAVNGVQPIEEVTQERTIEIAEGFEKHVFKGLKAAAKKYQDIKLGEDE